MAVGTLVSVTHHGSVSIALPTIATHFGTDLATVQWVVIAEALTVSALLLPMGRLSDILGRKQVYIAGLVIFTIGSAMAGLSGHIVALIVFKVLQGFGAAMSQGTAMAMITSVFPSEERGKSLGSIASVVGSGGVIGPVMGGLLVSALGWRSVFFVNVPLGLLAIVSALIIMDSRVFLQDGPRRGYDWLGAALSTATLVTFLLTVTNGSRAGWTSPPIMVALFSSAALLSAFIWWELHAPAPMLDLMLFGRKVFSLGVSASFLSFLGVSSLRFLLPFYLQAAMGYAPGQIGLILVPNAVSRIVMGPVSGRLSDRYGWRVFNVSGLMLSASGLLMLSTISSSSSLILVMAGIIVQSIGSGIFQSPNSSSIFSAAEQSRHGVVSALLSLVRNSANVTGIAVAAAIVTATMASMGHVADIESVIDAGPGSGILDAFTAGLRATYMTMGVLALLAAVASVFKGGRIQRTTPASSQLPQQ